MAGSPMAEPEHVPVLADRVTALLMPALGGPGAVLVDATLGRAGHARALLEACPGLLLIGVDAALPAIEAPRELLAPYPARATLVHPPPHTTPPTAPPTPPPPPTPPL